MAASVGKFLTCVASATLRCRASNRARSPGRAQPHLFRPTAVGAKALDAARSASRAKARVDRTIYTAVVATPAIPCSNAVRTRWS